jgi:hypothetical protein
MGQRNSTQRSNGCKKPTRLPLPWALWQEIALLLDIKDIAMFVRVCHEAAESHRRQPMCPLELDLTNRVFASGKPPVPPNLARWSRLKVLDLSGHSAMPMPHALLKSRLPPGLEELRWSGVHTSLSLHGDFWVDVLCEPRSPLCEPRSPRKHIPFFFFSLCVSLKDEQDRLRGQHLLNFWYDEGTASKRFEIGAEIMDLWRKMVIDIGCKTRN